MIYMMKKKNLYFFILLGLSLSKSSLNIENIYLINLKDENNFIMIL